MPLQIGITGGIGSGKSVACKIFSALGVPTYDADSMAKKVMLNDELLKQALLKLFGENAYLQTGDLNRTFISSIVFKDEDKLNKLNDLVHPRVALDYQNWVKSHASYKYTVKEAALLFESGSYKQLDKIITVTAPQDIRISRVQFRDKERTREDIQSIIDKQWPEEDRIAKSDYILVNDESELLTLQVLELHKMFISNKK